MSEFDPMGHFFAPARSGFRPCVRCGWRLTLDNLADITECEGGLL